MGRGARPPSSAGDIRRLETRARRAQAGSDDRGVTAQLQRQRNLKAAAERLAAEAIKMLTQAQPRPPSKVGRAAREGERGRERKKEKEKTSAWQQRWSAVPRLLSLQ